MTVTPSQRIIILFSLSGALMVACIMVLFWFLLPRMHATRVRIDSRRATLTVTEQRRSNLQALKQETDSVAAAQTSVDQEIWSFTTEDSFYTTLSAIAKTAGVRGDEPKVSDAVPGTHALTRTVTMTFQGSLSNLEHLLDLIRAVKPLIGIQSVTLSGSSATDQTLQITAATVWQ